MKQTVWIARHGNRQDIVDRQWRKTAKWQDDPGLSPDGIIQAGELAARLKNENISHIFSSPFLRTIETAREVARVLDLKIKIEAGLSEWLRSDWFSPKPVLIPLEEKMKRFPEIDPSYKSHVAPVYPENFEEVESRVEKTVNRIMQEYGGNILLVGHGASVDAAAHALVGKDVEIFSPLCCLIKVVQNDDGCVLELNGDVSHLSSPEK